MKLENFISFTILSIGSRQIIKADFTLTSIVQKKNILLPFEYLGSYVTYRCTMSQLLRVSIEYFAAIEYLGSYVAYRCTMPWLLRVSIEYFAALSIWDLMSCIGAQCRDSFVFRLNILLPFEYLGSYVAYWCTMSQHLRVSIEYFAAIEYLGSYVVYRCTMPWLLYVSIEYFAAI